MSASTPAVNLNLGRLSSNVMNQLDQLVANHVKGLENKALQQVFQVIPGPNVHETPEDEAALVSLLFRRSLSERPDLVLDARWLNSWKGAGSEELHEKPYYVAYYLALVLSIKESLHTLEQHRIRSLLALALSAIPYAIKELVIRGEGDDLGTERVFFIFSTLQAVCAKYPAICGQIIREDRQGDWGINLMAAHMWIGQRDHLDPEAQFRMFQHETTAASIDEASSPEERANLLVQHATIALAITLGQYDILLPEALQAEFEAKVTNKAVLQDRMDFLNGSDFFREFRFQKKAHTNIRVCCYCGLYRLPEFPERKRGNGIIIDPFKLCSA